MRFALSTPDRPRKLAKRLQASLASSGITVPLNRSQHLVAHMLGYRDWQELASCIGREGVSPDDHYCAQPIVAARRAGQVAALVAGDVPVPLATEIVQTLHPTGVIVRDGTSSITGSTSFLDLGFTSFQGTQLRSPHRRSGSLSFVSGHTGSGKSTTWEKIGAEAVAQGKTVAVLNRYSSGETSGGMRILSMRDGLPGAISEAEALRPDTLLVAGLHDPEEFEAVARIATTGIEVCVIAYATSALRVLEFVTDYADIPSAFRTSPGAVSKVVSQRLARVMCQNCKIGAFEAVGLGLATEEEVGLAASLTQGRSNLRYARPEGCERCLSGYSHRTVVAEVLVPDDPFLVLYGSGALQQAKDHWLGNLGGATFAENAAVLMARGMMDPREFDLAFASPAEVDANRVERLMSARAIQT